MRKIYVLLLTLLITTLSNAQILTESFDGATFPPTGWTNVGTPATSIWARATVTTQTNPNNITPRSGAGMALYDAYNYASGEVADLSTPSINLTTGGPHRVSFWMYRDTRYSLYDDSLEVFISATAQSSTGATKLGRVSRHISDPPAVAAAGWYQYTYTIPGSFNSATNYIIFKATSLFGTEMVIDDVIVEVVPSCLAPTINVVSGNTTASLSWGAVSGASGYEWAVTTSATPPASGTATTLTSANATGLTGVTQYYAHVRTVCGGPTSSWSTFSFLTSIDCSTATAITGCGVSQSVSLTGTGVYNVSACGFSTPGNERLFTFTPTVSGTYTLNITAANAEYIDYFYKDAAGGCGPTGWTCIDDNNAVGTDVFGPLTAGTTYFILLDPEDASVTSTATFDLICPAVAPPSCLIAADYIAPLNAATNVTYQPNVTFTWNNVATATSYDVYLNPGTSPTIATTLFASNFAAQAGATTTGTWTGAAGSTSYIWYVVPKNAAGAATGCAISNSFITTAPPPPPANDNCSGAVSLSIGSGTCGTASNGNTLNATASGTTPIPTCGAGSSGFDDDVWYSFTPTAGQTIMNIDFATVSGNADMVAQIYTSSDNTCTGTFTAFACSDDEGPGSMPQFIGLAVTPGTTYFVRVFSYATAVNGEFTICAFTPSPPPPCTTNIAPASFAINVPVGSPVTFSWNASTGATSYDLYIATGSSSGPYTLIGNYATTTTSVTFNLYTTQYYWYVVPINAGGSATGCYTNTTTFTTENAPTNCVPLYSTGCTSSDRLELFRLKGESSELNINSGTNCGTPAYVDSTDHAVVIDLARGKSYWGQAKCGFANNYISAWIDANDNGLFENGERIINNLLIGSTLTNINFFVPLSTPTGNHRLRVRNVYYSSAPTVPTDPCNNYTYGETEDYLVNILAGGAAYTVSTYTPAGACYDAIGNMTVDPASLSGQSYIPIVDSLNAIVAQIYPDGNDLGTVSANYYINNGPVRQTATGQYYLDRNYTISVTKQPTSTYRLRLCYKTTELNAIIAQPGSGVTSQFDLNMTKITSNICLNAFAQQSPVLVSPTGFGSIGADRFLDFVGLNSFSTFFLHAGGVLLPVSISNIRGEVTGATNTVYWTTATEANNRKFVVERSVNGSNFTAIGEVATRAINGNSNTALQYSFVDANPVQGKAFYRLQMVDINARATYSQIVTLRRGAGKLEIVDVRPNPTTGVIYFNLLGVNNSSQFTLTLRTIEGKALIVKNNFTPLGAGVMDMSNLANGMYILEAVDVRSNEKAVFKVVKQ